MCLLELEHAVPATPAVVKDDVARVGRVLYEMLSGMPCLTTSPPLHDAAPELPRAMTTTVDDAAHGRFATIDELRQALRASRPDWLGPMRRPMPSVAPDAPRVEARRRLSAPGEPFFDPRSLVESRGQLAVADAVNLAGPLDDTVAKVRAPMPSELDAPPVAAFYQPPPVPAPARTSKILIAAGAFSGALLLAAVALAVFLSRSEPRGATASAPSAPSAVAKNSPPPASAPPAARPEDAPEIDEAPPAAVVATKPAAIDGGAARGEVTFRFEGDRSPRLVFVDGRTVGVTTKGARARCGQHAVKIGAKGVVRWLDLPCNGEQVIAVQPNGSWRAQ
jgi:hypothetical protein